VKKTLQKEIVEIVKHKRQRSEQNSIVNLRFYNEDSLDLDQSMSVLSLRILHK
jgi:hypothetical protein